MTVAETNAKSKQNKQTKRTDVEFCMNLNKLPNFLVPPNSINTLLFTTQAVGSPQRTTSSHRQCVFIWSLHRAQSPAVPEMPEQKRWPHTALQTSSECLKAPCTPCP